MGTLEDMFRRRAESNKKTADQYYARAKNGEGDEFYGKAKHWYGEAERNKQQAKEMKRHNK